MTISGTTTPPGRDPSVVVPLVEETLSVDRRTVETGKVRVRVIVEGEDHVFSEPLDRVSVEIERRPINRHIDAIPEPRVEGEFTILPVVEELLIVRRQLVLVEEVRVRTVTTTEVVEQTVVARKMRAVVDREASTPNQETET